MTDPTSQQFWLDLAKKLHKVVENQDKSETVNGDFYDTVTASGPTLNVLSERYPGSYAASDTIRGIPTLLMKCKRHKGQIPHDLALETAKAILTAGYLMVNPMRPGEFSDSKFYRLVSLSYDFPSLSAASGMLYEEVAMKPIRLKLA
jgi:hypothetical protein